MTDTSQGAEKAKIHEGKEADHHPYFRPRDAATLILVDRSGNIPKVLVGKRHDKVVFMPGKFVFPGGRVDKDDYRVPVAAPITRRAGSQSRQGQPEDSGLARKVAGDCRNPRGLRRDRPLPRTQDRGESKTRGRLEAVRGCGPAARSLQPVPDRACDHSARPRQALRHTLLHGGRFRDHPPRRGGDPCGCRTGRAGLGRTRLKAARRSAPDDTQRAQRARHAPCHRPAPSRRAGAVLPFLRRQDAEGYFELIQPPNSLGSFTRSANSARHL
ncbi:hypothetical protein ACVWZ3_004507 [Bradyrhizobium sp. i1.3.6]